MAIIKYFTPAGAGKQSSTLVFNQMLLDLARMDRDKPIKLDVEDGKIILSQPPGLVMPRKKRQSADKKKSPVLTGASEMKCTSGGTATKYDCPLCLKHTLVVSEVEGTKMYHCGNCDSGQLVAKLQAMGIL